MDDIEKKIHLIKQEYAKHLESKLNTEKFKAKQTLIQHGEIMTQKMNELSAEFQKMDMEYNQKLVELDNLKKYELQKINHTFEKWVFK